MVTIRLLGRVLPSGIEISAQAPELKWKWEQENAEPVFRVKIDRSTITVECDIEKYEERYISELHRRATDLAKVTANMAAFATGYGITVVIETLIDQNGVAVPIRRQESIPPSSRSAFSLDPTAKDDFDRTFQIVLREPPLFIALDDLIASLTSPHTQLADCGRVVESIRRMIVPTLNGAPAWAEMQRVLNISKPYQEWISQQSTGSRHGDSTHVPGDICSEAIQRTWAILNRFVEFRKRGGQPLGEPDFPQLA